MWILHIFLKYIMVYHTGSHINVELYIIVATYFLYHRNTFSNNFWRIVHFKPIPLVPFTKTLLKFNKFGTSLVVQWLRICLPMQGTRIRALVREDLTCCRAVKPMRHNYWACALEPVSHNSWAREPQLLKPMRLEPVLCSKRSHHNEKPAHHNEE